MNQRALRVFDNVQLAPFGLDIRTYASPKVGQDQMSGGVSVLCWHVAPVANVLWKPCIFPLLRQVNLSRVRC